MMHPREIVHSLHHFWLWWLRPVSYVALTIAGIGMVAYEPLVLTHALGHPLTIALGIALAASALVCSVSAFMRRWRWEMVALFPLGAAVTGYAFVAWTIAVMSWPGRAVEALCLTALAFLLADRIEDLWTLNREAPEAKRQRAILGALRDE